MGRSSPEAVSVAESSSGDVVTEVYFAPFDPVEHRILEVLDGVRHEVLVAHYNIRRKVILEKLVELSRRGVVVRVVVDQKNSNREWNTGDDYLDI